MSPKSSSLKKGERKTRRALSCAPYPLEQAEMVDGIRASAPRACSNCRRMKKRCGAERPCRWCLSHNVECKQPPHKDRHYHYANCDDESPSASVEPEGPFPDFPSDNFQKSGTLDMGMQYNRSYNSTIYTPLLHSSLQSSPSSSISNGSAHHPYPAFVSQNPGSFLPLLDSAGSMYSAPYPSYCPAPVRHQPIQRQDYCSSVPSYRPSMETFQNQGPTYQYSPFPQMLSNQSSLSNYGNNYTETPRRLRTAQSMGFNSPSRSLDFSNRNSVFGLATLSEGPPSFGLVSPPMSVLEAPLAIRPTADQNDWLTSPILS